MKVLLSLFKGAVFTTARMCYRVYSALKIKTGKNPTILLPLIVEGKGSVELGDYVSLKRHVVLSCSKGSSVKLGNRVNIGSRVKISVSNQSRIIIGEESSIQGYTHCYAHKNWHIGTQVKIAGHCQIFSREPGYAGALKIGDKVNIGDYTIIDVSADVIIGNLVALGPGCTIYTHDHDYKEENIAAPWKGSPVAKQVVIEDGAWVGSKVTILPGVRIGKNAIVATGSVVTKSIPAGTIYAGVPAKLVKTIAVS